MGLLSAPELIKLSCVLGLLLVHQPEKAVAQNKEELRHYPWFSGEDEGYVPGDLSSTYGLDWSNRKISRDGEEPVPDYLLESEGVDDILQHLSSQGGIQKRDYTASQLLSMLKQLAKARRHRQIRVTNKSLRFGISRK